MNFAKLYLYSSWSYILHALLVVIFVQIDIIMLKQMGISYEEIGLYSVALKVYAIAIIFANVLFKQYYPIVARYIQNNEIDSLKPFIVKIQSMNLFFSIYFAIFIMLFSKEIIYFGFGEAFHESSKMLIMLSIIVIFRFSMYTYTSILSSSNLNHLKLYSSIVCVITNITLNYILIPKYGIYGAIIATIITELILVILFKINSLKVIFTNYITFNEIMTLFLSIIFLLFSYMNDLEIYTKLYIFLGIILTIFIQSNKIISYISIKRLSL